MPDMNASERPSQDPLAVDMSCFFPDNTFVLPGDVLLLRSRGSLAHLSRVGQRALRLTRPLRTARFTHVALVINRTHIVDAMPRHGVRIRRWKDAEPGYDLAACVVARHPALSADPQLQTALLARVQYYYKQRYKLTSLARRKLKSDKGLVCSQFVALVLAELGLPEVVGNAMQGLPSDIDHHTRNRNGWRQFPLSGYGLCMDTNSPAPEQANGPMENRGPGAVSVPDVELSHARTALRLSDAVGERLASSMASYESLSRTLAMLDRALLGQIEGLSALTPEAAEARIGNLLRLLGEDPAAMPATGSSADLLEHWQVRYLREGKTTALVLADEDAPDRAARHRKELGRRIQDMSTIAARAVSHANTFMERFYELEEFVEKGVEIPPAYLSLLCESGLNILETMVWLKDESAQAILDRGDVYPAHVKALTERHGIEEDIKREAFDQLQALLNLDATCVDWLTGPDILLRQVTGDLAGLLAGGR